MLWLRYFALPSVDDYRDLVVSSIEKASGTSVTVGAIRGGWGGLRPSLTLEQFRIADRRGREALAFDRAEVTLSWWALFFGSVRFHDVDFYRPAISLHRRKDGLVYLADKPINEAGQSGDDRLAEWLLAQPRIAIHDATLAWRDDLAEVPELLLTGVEIDVRKRRGRHFAALSAVPPRALAMRVDLRAEGRLVHEAGHWKGVGEAYVEALHANLAQLRRHFPLPETLRSGVGSVRLWGTFDREGLREITSDLRMRDAQARLAADVLPLDLASLSGRATYRAEPQGFSFSAKGLRFRLASGVEARPGNFSLRYSAPAGQLPQGEAGADGIDLKIAATLLDYFPVPPDLKRQIAQTAPRGHLTKAALSWTGESVANATAYALKGDFQDLAIDPVEGRPGVSGLSGSVEGTQAGGVLKLASRKARLDATRVFRAPVEFDTLSSTVRWKRTGDALEVAIEEARFANADAAGQVSGLWRSLPQAPRSPGFVDLKGSLSHANAGIIRHLPNGIAGTRAWLERALLAGRSPRATFELKGDLFQFPFADGSGRFVVEGDIRDGRLKYHPDWPSVDAIHGTLRFDGPRMEIRAERGAIFSSRIGATTAIIERLDAKPPVLLIEGEVETSGADAMRFLRESPLATGPGRFTRAIAIEGPGRLKLRLDFPLWGEAPARVAGDYQFAGATASMGRNLALRDVKGQLAFTENGVRAPEITGTLFGSPAVLRIASQPDGRIVSDLEGRIDAASMRAHLSEAIGARMSGAADWKARLVTVKDTNELTIASDLKGLGVALPEPLAKKPGEARALAVTISPLGADNEVTHARLGADVHARFGRRSVGGADRWHAALKFGGPIASEPVRDGAWLYGNLASLDVDAWQALFSAHPAAGPSQAPEIELRGMDLKMARVRYLGRDFSQVAVRLEKAGAEWTGRLDGPMVAGEVRWSPGGKGRLAAKLAHLQLAQAAGAAGEPQAAEREELPALDVSAEKFDFRGRWLGRLEMKAQPVGEEWRIERLDITNAHAQFRSSGGWRKTGAGSITTLNVKLETDNLAILLTQFGHGDYVKRGNGHLEGQLVWPGLPHAFALENLSGTLKVEARRGQFAKIEPGAGKLLGLLSLQSLPRRALFDFRDVFSEGFAFERIHGNVKVARGILLTEDFEIGGPSAFVTLAGEVSLPRETQSLTLRVVPEVTEGVALAATLLGTPVLGLSTLLVSKLLQNPLGKVVAYEYLVTGTWDNPSVTRTSGPPAKAAATPPPS